MRPRPLVLSLLAFLALAPAGAQPAPTRHVVNAVADGAQPRILVRWSEYDGGAPRFRLFDLLRRRADELSFTQLNDEPIHPAPTAAEIVAAFTAPGRAEALAAIVDVLGPDYAAGLLRLQSPAAQGNDLLQLRMLPDQNFVASLVLGLGFVDDGVLPGTTYVYEVWGLDERGSRVERLGSASATALQRRPLGAVASVGCVDPGDVRADLAAFLRFGPAAASAEDRVAGYDVLRVARNGNGTCPPIARGLPGVRQANRYPVSGKSPGNRARGAELLAAHCTSCHAGGRDAAPLAGSTEAQARRRMFRELWSTGAEAAHDVAALHALPPEDWEAIYDFVSEFQFRDDGRHTPDQPLQAGQSYCYQVVPRDLLGQHGDPVPAPPACLVRDRRPPEQPQGLRVERVVQGPAHEACQISWERNAAPGDDTARYVVLRVPDDAPRRAFEVPGGAHADVPQPASGDRVAYLDTTQSKADAGRAFFYGVFAKDAEGNASPTTGWIPCTPRDLVSPGIATITPQCPAGPRCGTCRNWGTDPKWTNAGGAPDYWILGEGNCSPEIAATATGDPFRYQPFTSYDGVT